MEKPSRSLSSYWQVGLPLIIGLGVILFARQGITPPPPVAQPLVWAPLKMDLPKTIKVFTDRGDSPTSPRAWYVDINYNDKILHAETWLSKHPSGRETASVMAKKLGALVAINGGYFDMMGNPARTFSLVMRGGKVLVPNIPVVTRHNPPRSYPVTRSAFGIRNNRSFDVAWVASQGGTLWAYPQPVAHTVGTVAPAPSRDSSAGGRAWDVVEAIGAGPTLISDGVIQDTYENEVFFGSGFNNEELYPRAAIGYTKNKHLILFTTDGRRRGTGLSLNQLAREMQRLGCIEAMNLDGGGSETLVVNGKCLNQSPLLERPVTSMLAIVPKLALREAQGG